MFRRFYRVLALVGLAVAMLVTSCTGNTGNTEPTEPAATEPMATEPAATEPAAEEPTATPEEDMEATATPEEDMEATATPEEEATPEEDISGQTVSVLAVWGGSEQEAFMAMIEPWEERTGATVAYEGTRDINAVLTTRVSGGNPPDIAGLPGPGQLRTFASEGELVDMSTFMDMDLLNENYAENWIQLGTWEGGLHGVFIKAAVKSLIWYSPTAFDNTEWEVPTESWDQMIQVSQQIVDAGETPWCIGLESGAASGWPGTDWIEDIMLRTAGPETYDQWWQHEIAWTDDAVRNAFTTWGEIVTNPEMVNGGQTGMLATNFGTSVYPLLQDPPGCYLHRQATFIQGFIKDQFPDAQAGEDFDFYKFPQISGEGDAPLLVAGDLFGMFNDTPAARSLMQWLVSAEAQQIWAERGGYIATNRQVPTDVYPDPILAQAAEMLAEAETVRFDASDLMPSAVNNAFWSGVLNYIENPDQLDQILQNIEEIAAENY